MRSRGPFVRWSDLPGGRLPQSELRAAEAAGDLHWARNGTGATRKPWEVLQLDGHVIDPVTGDADLYQSRIVLKGVAVDDEETLRFGVLQRTVAAGDVGEIALAGITYARLTGPENEDVCGPEIGSAALKAGSGPCAILYDPGPAAGERIAIVRIDNARSLLRVHFVIDDVDQYGTATVTITYRPCGVSKAPKEQSGKLSVIDPAGCYFNEPPADLIGRYGHADYMKSADYGAGVCEWIVSGLCCPGA